MGTSNAINQIFPPFCWLAKVCIMPVSYNVQNNWFAFSNRESVPYQLFCCIFILELCCKHLCTNVHPEVSHRASLWPPETLLTGFMSEVLHNWCGFIGKKICKVASASRKSTTDQCPFSELQAGLQLAESSWVGQIDPSDHFSCPPRHGHLALRHATEISVAPWSAWCFILVSGGMPAKATKWKRAN